MKKAHTYLLALMTFAVFINLSALASEIHFTTPTNGTTYYALAGWTYADIYVSWNATPNPNSIAYRTRAWRDGIEIIGGPQTFSFTISGHTCHAELFETNSYGEEFKTAEVTISFTVLANYNVTFKNDFTYGQIKVGDWNSRPTHNSPYVESLHQNDTRVIEAFN